MKKTIYVVRVNNYFPELCEITLPTIKAYATKIGAEYTEITERKFPDFPPTYEKLQVYELGKDNDYNILIDADFMIHKDAVDFTEGISKGYVGFLSGFPASMMFIMDDIFKKDKRNMGVAGGFLITDRETHKFWEPLNEPWEEARKHTKREFIIDEYCMSHNIAKYNLKFTGLNYCKEIEYLFQHVGVEESNKEEVLSKAKRIKQMWGI